MTNLCVCPVCDKKLTSYIDKMGMVTLEEHIYCDRCGYTYDYAYGATYEKIVNKEFTSHIDSIEYPWE